MTPPKLSELEALERIIELGAGKLETRIACEVKMPKGDSYPVHVIALGNPDPKIPAVGYFGGVHGLERIGAGVVIAYLQSLVMRLQWDSTLHKQLESVRLVFMPIVNPGGMALGTRANPNGVDLMRNSPVEARDSVPFLIGGQRIRQLIAAARFHAPLVKPPVPTLLLTSEQDHLVSVNCSKTLASYWQCDLRVHSSAGHDLPLDDGPWVAAQVQLWLAKRL